MGTVAIDELDPTKKEMQHKDVKSRVRHLGTQCSNEMELRRVTFDVKTEVMAQYVITSKARQNKN